MLKMMKAVIRHVRRPLFLRSADTREGRRIIAEANWLEWRYPHLTDAQLIRLAYWGWPGSAD